MADRDDEQQGPVQGTLLDELPLDHLKDGVQDLLTALVERGVGLVTNKIEDVTGRLTESAENGGTGLMAAVTGGKKLAEGASPVKAALSAGTAGIKEKAKQALGAGGEGKKEKKKGDPKVVNIIENVDIGLPLRVVYNQWTEFENFPGMTKKVLTVDQDSDEKLNWQAKIFLSTRSWEATIVEQVPDERIIWTSTGAKGTVDGCVTFHRLAPNMTRVLLVLEYYPAGFLEKTAYMWRAQGRRVRADFRYIKRYMMTQTILEPDEVEGWRGEIRDSEVVKTHDEALQEEKERESEEYDRESTREDRGEYGETGEAGEAEYDEAEDADYDEEGEEEEGTDEYDEADYDEDVGDEEEQESTGRERARARR